MRIFTCFVLWAIIHTRYQLNNMGQEVSVVDEIQPPYGWMDISKLMKQVDLSVAKVLEEFIKVKKSQQVLSFAIQYPLTFNKELEDFTHKR